MSDTDTIALTLEENAKDSLLHVFEHLTEDEHLPTRDLKFAILHATHGLELLLKAYLAKQHDLLIFTRPESAPHGHTVTLDVAVERCDKCGLSFDKSERQIITQAKKLRNQIEHSDFSASRTAVENSLYGILIIALDILENEFGELREDLTRASMGWLGILERVEGYEARLEEVSNRAAELMRDPRDGADDEIVRCEECGAEGVVLPPPDYPNPTKCVSCGETWPDWFQCNRCGGYCLGESESEVCDDCMSYLWAKN